MNYVRLLLLLVLLASSGCAKGALWRLGYLSPQVRQQWADEEKYAKTWPTQKAEMTSLVERANVGGAAEQQRVASQLATILRDDHRIMVRLHATNLLSKLPPDAARAAVAIAAEDPEADVRIVACQTLASFGDSDSLLELQRVLGRDTNPDVQIAATRAMGSFKSAQAAKGLSMAIQSDHPALQLAAADSLSKCTGEKFGHDIPKWEEYLSQFNPASTTDSPSDYPNVVVSHDEPESKEAKFGQSIRSIFR